jgi:hypothetical protein
MAKDKIAQSKIVRKGPPAETAVPTPKVQSDSAAKKPAPTLVEINQEELDKKIEAALSEDLTK